ncbi:MAG: hypothetical protein D3906_05670, partial [Candidatus Electrothrix sp. AUS1_2]|nr:hypothetical protein [Candidatus Electrothrix sp. AUS1_2]
ALDLKGAGQGLRVVLQGNDAQYPVFFRVEQHDAAFEEFRGYGHVFLLSLSQSVILRLFRV